MDNTETLANLDTQDTGRRQAKQKNTRQKTKQKDGQHRPHQYRGWIQAPAKYKQLLPPTRHPPCYSLSICVGKDEYLYMFEGLRLWCLTPPSTIFQLHRGGQFYRWRKPEYLQKIIEMYIYIICNSDPWIIVCIEI
jgi:hypothetical protein